MCILWIDNREGCQIGLNSTIHVVLITCMGCLVSLVDWLQPLCLCLRMRRRMGRGKKLDIIFMCKSTLSYKWYLYQKLWANQLFTLSNLFFQLVSTLSKMLPGGRHGWFEAASWFIARNWVRRGEININASILSIVGPAGNSCSCICMWRLDW